MSIFLSALAFLMLLVLIAMAANKRHEIDSEGYEKYLFELDEMKKRKRNRLDLNLSKEWCEKAADLEGDLDCTAGRPQIGTFEKRVDEDGFERVEIKL